MKYPSLTSAVLSLLVCASGLFASDEDQPPIKPNILFLFADDQRADTIAALGNPLGNFQWIVWQVSPVTPLAENTAIQELAVEVAAPAKREK